MIKDIKKIEAIIICFISIATTFISCSLLYNLRYLLGVVPTIDINIYNIVVSIFRVVASIGGVILGVKSFKSLIKKDYNKSIFNSMSIMFIIIAIDMVNCSKKVINIEANGSMLIGICTFILLISGIIHLINIQRTEKRKKIKTNFILSIVSTSLISVTLIIKLISYYLNSKGNFEIIPSNMVIYTLIALILNILLIVIFKYILKNNSSSNTTIDNLEPYNIDINVDNFININVVKLIIRSISIVVISLTLINLMIPYIELGTGSVDNDHFIYILSNIVVLLILLIITLILGIISIISLKKDKLKLSNILFDIILVLFSFNNICPIFLHDHIDLSRALSYIIPVIILIIIFIIKTVNYKDIRMNLILLVPMISLAILSYSHTFLITLLFITTEVGLYYILYKDEINEVFNKVVVKKYIVDPEDNHKQIEIIECPHSYNYNK